MAQFRNEGRNLDWWQLAALTGLRALRHLNLNLFGPYQIFSRHAETGRGHLLDLAAHRMAFERLMIPVGVFTALARIVASTNAVHGCGNRAMRLWAERAYGHSRND